MKKIIFYAPLGKDTPPEKIGGAEAGCLKTKQIYENAGFEVIVLDKPATSKGRIRFVIEMCLIPLKLFVLAKKNGSNTPVHIVGFYTKIAQFERLLMNVAHFCGNKVIYEIRNGSMVSTYENGSTLYKKCLKDLLLKPEIVLCQGMEYIHFIKKMWNVERTYYPNYIMDSFVTPNNLHRPSSLKLIYFGRVTEAKNVDITIRVLSLIRHAGHEATLDIIGGCSESYLKELEDLAIKENVRDYLHLYGRKPFDFISDKLKNAHYFIFPSTEKQEGHSNSLTEAMGCGVVPIVSSAGFNASICGNPELVISGINPENYAQKIIAIESQKRWRDLSEKSYQHIINNFTQSIVSKNLVETISSLYK